MCGNGHDLKHRFVRDDTVDHAVLRTEARRPMALSCARERFVMERIAQAILLLRSLGITDKLQRAYISLTTAVRLDVITDSSPMRPLPSNFANPRIERFIVHSRTS